MKVYNAKLYCLNEFSLYVFIILVLCAFFAYHSNIFLANLFTINILFLVCKLWYKSLQCEVHYLNNFFTLSVCKFSFVHIFLAFQCFPLLIFKKKFVIMNTLNKKVLGQKFVILNQDFIKNVYSH